MARLAFYLILLAAAAYFYTGGYYVGAFLCAAWLAYLVLQNRLSRVFSILSRLERIPDEHGCNTSLNCRLSVEHVVAHPSVENLYRSLHAEGKVGAESFADWTTLLMENYKRTFKREKPFEEVTFNVNNNLVFKNKEADFWVDAVYHEFAIPFRCPEDAKKGDRGFMTPSDEIELSIRLFIVNGILQVQIGNFSKRHSPKILHEGGLDVYETWATVTQFPLIYFSYQHGLPVRYLNLSSHATDSYKAHFSSRGQKQQKKPFWKRTPSMFDDWRVLQQEVAAYRILCDQDSNNYSHSAVDKLAQSFATKREAMLKQEGFSTHKRDDDESWRFPDHGHEYWNDHMYLHFQNLNLRRDYAEEHWWTDYYEEMP
jgi:hypothetical protein